MLVAKFINKKGNKISYVPVLGWYEGGVTRNKYPCFPGEEDTESAGRLIVENSIENTYGKIVRFLFSAKEIEMDILDTREKDENISEFYLYSDTLLGE